MVENISTNIPTLLGSLGNNFSTYNFQNSEAYIFSFYVNDIDNNLYISILDQNNNPIMTDRKIVLSNDLFGDTQLLGKISVIGDEPDINTIDVTCNIYYNYQILI